ncbi:MAG: alpha/beta fold hydrolase [Chthoniobacterales bacterium]
MKPGPVAHKSTHVDGLKIFYREADLRQAPVVLWLHGFPTSRHMFRNLIPKLAGQFYVVGPDVPGVGFSNAPRRRKLRLHVRSFSRTAPGR